MPRVGESNYTRFAGAKPSANGDGPGLEMEGRKRFLENLRRYYADKAKAGPADDRPPVCQGDLENLRASGLTDATIRANRLRTEKDALVFPYCDLDGNMTDFARRRPHVPRIIDGKLAKYVQPKGSPRRAYFPVASLAKLRDGTSPAYITEGEKGIGPLPAGIGSCGNWRNLVRLQE